ncbi:MerR family transcriptional regulator [Ehrlichia canis]|uniref:Transcriptional regulator, MerR family n=1 Tax=Ehrlichia canis (strain Jake) TaxID=269484 RepID=A0ACA6AV81_EHRCJ|nr:MerR family transcriptional regulator [Ehrlichia canis]AAZ68159.1 transcriptional regulator, MerR family [Ehrlichia canis str. Jake]AUO54415.1 MerR family transcriptional regulator [Ehrlichia canis]UKC53754.1 MerR family transcriptional regulator [Ehrlichia canis]UKC54692.1 MerR family transcriptional regulator [Ehrlichia canis]UKC55628.1 MerR family transcriptional regulator [Ehrlichia canis]
MSGKKLSQSSSKLQTIGEVAKCLNVEQYVLRFWEEKFPQINPIKRRGRRLYTQVDVDILKYIKHLLYDKGYKIKGVQQELSKKPVNIDKSNASVKQNVYREGLISLLDDMLNLRNDLLKKFDGM